MARTVGNEKKIMSIRDLPIESTDEKFNRYFKSNEDDVKKYMLRYFTMLSSVDEKSQVNKQEVRKELKPVTHQQTIDTNLESKEDIKTIKTAGQLKQMSKRDVRKVVARKSTEVAEKKMFNEKLKLLIKKLATTIHSEKDINNLKEYVLTERKAYAELLNFIETTHDDFLRCKLQFIVKDMKKKAPKVSGVKKRITRKSLSKNIENPEYSNQIESPEKPIKLSKNTKNDSCNEGRRKSLRLSSHPPGHFQTKPVMVMYYESDGAENKRKSTSSIQQAISETDKADVNVPLRHSLPKVKRRKLYNLS